MPTGTTSDITRHSFAAPAFEPAKVLDAMRLGVVSCPPDTSLRVVVRIMATYRIHSVVVGDMPEAAPLGVISDIDVAAGALTRTRSPGRWRGRRWSRSTLRTPSSAPLG